MEFLQCTQQVSSDVTGYGFVEAARFEKLDAMKFLYKHRRIYPHSINKAFELTGSLMILNFLFEKAEISLDAMTEVFKHVTESREVWLKSHDTTSFRRSEDRIGIIKFLCNTGCIPSGMIDTAFVRAATNGYVNVMAALHDAQGLNTMTINKALIYHDHASIVNVLSTKPGLSTKMIARALETAASRGNVGVVKALCGKQQLPSELLAKIVEEEAMDGGSTRLIEALYDRQYLYVDPIADGLVNAALLRIS
ncbi:hypothetical protein GN244_ATG10512 [Phytophthora infestans]|uniref:Uncharacterized protein n=1 Tax=Phytophthora infestans TaxID=4787 RepID=A0A833SSX2_PHYIN|nr:hypothetical protein GN244_ATG10512 [Phytophthora infestans]